MDITKTLNYSQAKSLIMDLLTTKKEWKAASNLVNFTLKYEGFEIHELRIAIRQWINKTERVERDYAKDIQASFQEGVKAADKAAHITGYHKGYADATKRAINLIDKDAQV